MLDRKLWTPGGCEGNNHPDTHVFHDYVLKAEKLEVGIEAVFKAWELVKYTGSSLKPGSQNSLMLILLLLFSSIAEGNTRLSLVNGMFLDRLLIFLETDTSELNEVKNLVLSIQAISRGETVRGLSEIVGTENEYQPLVVKDDCLFLHKYFMLEKKVAEAFLSRINNLNIDSIMGGNKGSLDGEFNTILEEVLNRMPLIEGKKAELNSEQLIAVKSAFSGRILMISGPPGSGKTFIIGTLLRVMAKLSEIPLELIVLSAPTGKAAEKMSDSLIRHLAAIPNPMETDKILRSAAPVACTLHRLLGYSPKHDRFKYNINNPLPARLVIVDESSMVDIYMMNNLLQALNPNAGVIFLGDIDQLPSVEPGSVFRDFCQSEEALQNDRIVYLTKGYRFRQDSSVEDNLGNIASSLKEGTLFSTKKHDMQLLERQRSSELNFRGVEHLIPGDAAQRLDFFQCWYNTNYSDYGNLQGLISRVYVEEPEGFDPEEALLLRELFAHYEKFKILCATRVTAGGTGTENINKWFRQQWIKGKFRGEHFAAADSFLPGEPVIVTKNDYRLNLYNGDSGVVLWVQTNSSDAELMAVFFKNGVFIAFPLGLIRGKLELAWAITIHKAQGSEYNKVAIILPDKHVKPLTRELLYTAVTRAKESVVIIGSTDILKSGIGHFIERESGLADMLSKS